MKYLDYLKDKIVLLFAFILLSITMFLLFLVLNCHILVILGYIITNIILFFFTFVYDYLRKRKFYNNIEEKINALDKKYLITELIKNDSFLEATIIKNYLYLINKSYLEDINKYKYESMEFKDYIELWCHEIKTPLSTIELIIANNRNEITNSIEEEMERISYFIEQVLFYARSENVEKDYIIKEINLKDIVKDVIKSNKKNIINKKIKIDMFKNEVMIKSDAKWLSFIINQIIINSIKYSKKNGLIDIQYKDNKNNKELIIYDNGIGIKENEIDKVFDKGFTGNNGRKIYNSTGIGLYLCQKLCYSLGHKIKIESKENEYTKVTIIFPNSSMY